MGAVASIEGAGAEQAAKDAIEKLAKDDPMLFGKLLDHAQKLAKMQQEKEKEKNKPKAIVECLLVVGNGQPGT